MDQSDNRSHANFFNNDHTDSLEQFRNFKIFEDSIDWYSNQIEIAIELSDMIEKLTDTGYKLYFNTFCFRKFCI